MRQKILYGKTRDINMRSCQHIARENEYIREKKKVKEYLTTYLE